MAIDQALYTATCTSTGGRAGTTKSSDGRISLNLSTPKGLGGDDGQGTNPEQLFASGYSACFIGAMKAVAAKQKMSLPGEVEQHRRSVDRTDDRQARRVRHHGGDEYLDSGHEQGRGRTAGQGRTRVCPYSNATRGNLDVKLTVV